jgi:hypothetical protein
MKNILKEYITTLIGLAFLIYMGIDLYRVSIDLQVFEWKFTAGMAVSGLLLLRSSDRWITTILNKLAKKITG